MKKHLQFYGTAALLMVLMLVSISTATNAARPASEAAPPPPGSSKALVPETHDRLGQLNWQTVSGNTARITATAGSRRSYPGFPTPPNVGDVVPFATIVFGDGQQSANQNFVCTFVDLLNDWVLLEKVETHTYSNTGPFTASFGTCCRLELPQHINNNGNQNFRSETIVNFAFTTANPVSQLPAIVDCPREGNCAFQIPASDPDGQLMKYRLSTTTEAGDPRFVQPGPPQAPHAAAIDHDTGLYTWDTHGAQINSSGGDTLYSTQVMIENVDFTGRVLTKTPLDFFIRLIPVTNNPPVFIYPPTPPDNTLFTIIEGTHLNFTVRARDIDPGDVVTLNVIGLPSGATFPIPVPSSLVQSNFDWTPTGSQAGSYVLNFTATDQSSASAFTSVRINVVANTPTVTNTPQPTRTSTPTRTATRTNTPVPPTSTPTATLPPPPPSETATALPTNTPVCNASPTPVVTPAFTPGPGCSAVPHHGDLDATIIDHPTTTEARFTNYSRTCSYPIGLAIYKKFDNNIDHQQLYDYALAVIPPRTTLTLVVNNPTCAYQADAFYGNIITSFAGGVRYNERRLDDTNGNGTNYCTPGCNPLPTPVPTGVTDLKPKLNSTHDN